MNKGRLVIHVALHYALDLTDELKTFWIIAF